MDGDVADLKGLARVAGKHGAELIVDEAHAFGVFGKGGAGLVEEAGLSGQCAAVVATFSKAYGSQGGFVAGSKSLIEFLVNRARSFVYSTGMSPATSAASLEALRISAAEPELRKRLHANVARMRSKLVSFGFDLSGSVGPIVPIFVGKTSQALALSEQLLESGILVPAIRPPTVPKGTDRLRATVTAAHTDDQIDRFCEVIKKCV